METKIRFYLTDTPVKEGTAVGFSTPNDWSKTDDIAKGLAGKIPYATGEPDYFLLDGNFKFAPDTWDKMHVGYMGADLSDASGGLSSGQTIHMQFASAHAVNTITIHGQEASGDYPAHMLIRYFNSGQILQDKYIYPNSVHFTFSNLVSNVDEIHFTIYRTNKPFRRARISDITFGDVVEYRGSDIRSAKAVRQASLAAETLPVGTFSANIFSLQKIGDLTNANSLIRMMKDRMAFDVLHDNGESVRFVGRYYLEEWDNPSVHEIKFSGYDLIGLMDNYDYAGDYWSSDEDFTTVVGRVLSQMPPVKEVWFDPYIPTIKLRGPIEPGTIRTALQQVFFAAGLSGSVWEESSIYVTYQRWQNLTLPSWVFTKSDKMLENLSLKTKQLITQVNLTSHNYASATASSRVHQSELEAGDRTIKFSKPAYVIASGVSGATLLETKPFYAIVRVATKQTVTITGTEYVDSLVAYTENLIDPATAKANPITVEKATLISPTNVNQIMNRLKSFALLKFTQKFRVVDPGFFSTGYVYLVDTNDGKKIAMAAERIEIDLSNGFTCDFTGSGLLQGDFGEFKIELSFDSSWQGVGKIRDNNTQELLCDTTGVNNLVYYYPAYSDPGYHLKFWIVSDGVEKAAKTDWDFYFNDVIYQQATGAVGIPISMPGGMLAKRNYRLDLKNLVLA